ncbi:unnamed protein product [Rhizoctonia solani]|uniref:Ammonia transport outward protein 2 n=1 Tax=Rhizoctonia solani TaxID=456999 RepID=A0A8H2XXX9_9AGAM|nr:unnamed protein product [Rhizoctonia solani]
MSASNHTFDAEKGVNGAGGNGYTGGPALHHTISADTQRAFPVYHRKLGNPAPLGLFGFASTTLILSLYNAGARGITTPNAVVGMALGVGGLCQLLAGMWEFAAGNTFGATAFSMYGGFWLSFGAIYWPGSGILEAYTGEAASQLPSALGIYLITWMIITFLLFLATFRSSVALSGVFFFLVLTFMMLAISEFTGSAGAHKAGGILGCITAMIAFYTGSAGLYSPDASYFVLPVGDLPKRRDD